MNILIVDDEPLARTRLQSLLSDVASANVIGEASNGEQALAMVQQHQPDVVLLDIRMPGMDGMETAAHLSNMENPPAIIFTTAYDQYALDAFKSRAVDYLLKPIKQQQLQQALSAATRLSRAQLQSLEEMQEQQSRQPLHISARVQGELRLIPVSDILYFLAEHKYVTVRYRDGEVLIEEPLISLEKKFGDRFLRIHRNALVAKHYIQALKKNSQGQFYLQLQYCDNPLEISRRHLPEVRRIIKTLATA